GSKTFVLVVHAEVDGDHCQFVIAECLGKFRILPGSVLIENSLAVHKFISGIVRGLGGKFRAVAGGVCDVQVKKVLVVVKIGSLDGVCVVDSLFRIFIVDGKICKVGLISPVGRSVHTSG